MRPRLAREPAAAEDRLAAAGDRDADPRLRLLERAVPGSPPGCTRAAAGRPHWPPARRPAEAALIGPNRVRRTMKPMGTLDSVVHGDPEILGGTPVFRGTRVPVKNLLDYLAAGDSLGQFLDDFPTVRRDQAVASWLAAQRLR